MNGRRLPLHWPGKLRELQRPQNCNMYSLLDAAAYVATAPLDLSDPLIAPDFACLSFYKIFGLPDLGALIVHKDAGHLLRKRRYFAGGTVDMVINDTVESWFARKLTSLHEILEDGTPPFHSIIALESAIRVHQKLYGNMRNVSLHTGHLCKILNDRISALRHYNGSQVCRIYQDPASRYGHSESQGPAIAFNVRKANGEWVRKTDFENLAIVNDIQLRTGGVCNPGGIAWALSMTPSDMRQNYAEGLRCGNGVDEINGRPTGIIRVSLGAMSAMTDITTFITFLGLFVESCSWSPAVQGSVEVEKIEQIDDPPAATVRPVMSYRENTAHEHKSQQSQMLRLICPVAACKKDLDSEQALLRHFNLHRIRSNWRSRFHLDRTVTYFCRGL